MAQATPQLATSRKPVRTVTGWTLFFMVLLRIAIGWHFFYEGAWKLMQDEWRATPYLVASVGPFREVFRWMVDDVDGLEMLEKENVVQRLEEEYERYKEFYGLTEEQQVRADKVFEDKKKYTEQLFDDPDFIKQKTDYLALLVEIEEQEKMLGTTDYNIERLTEMYRKKAMAKSAILTRAEAGIHDLPKNNILGVGPVLTQKQAAEGPFKTDHSPTLWIDWSNMIALTAVGACLMLGLFTRLAAIGAMGLLLMYYFPHPPWPGLPHNPMAEGHYLIINKNLIEALALAMIATSRIGRWGGLDAYFAAAIDSARGEPTRATAPAGARK
jgi:uncharacterized membrane protein YphA (DoxX/SURF4 family)/uncharacterized protein YozE (UPF0346 family)